MLDTIGGTEFGLFSEPSCLVSRDYVISFGGVKFNIQKFFIPFSLVLDRELFNLSIQYINGRSTKRISSLLKLKDVRQMSDFLGFRERA